MASLPNPPDSQSERAPIIAIPTHGFEVIFKLVVTVAIGTLGAIVADGYFQKIWGETPIHIMGVVIVALTILRSFTDGTYGNYKRQAASTENDARAATARPRPRKATGEAPSRQTAKKRLMEDPALRNTEEAEAEGELVTEHEDGTGATIGEARITTLNFSAAATDPRPAGRARQFVADHIGSVSLLPSETRQAPGPTDPQYIAKKRG